MALQLVNGRWLYDNKPFQELNHVEKKLFAILLKVEMIVHGVKTKNKNQF